jgi:putative protease
VKKPELLLPVGTRDMLYAAVQNGADAVYYGVPHWNARGRTEDFSLDDVREMIRYARLYGVKTYLAMNILVFQKELEELPRYLEELIGLGPDGFIIQDIGLARLIRGIAPEQEIHASTQMTLASAEAVNLAAKLGFNRAVLARELSLKEIAKIKEATPLELEVFVHGALCVSYSGQCLTSENFGGRSANRGQCAQSCRLPYRIFVDGKEFRETNAAYLFSPHDLCALPVLEELQGIGVESLKVEGRLKSPEYVAAVAKAYRKELDQPGKLDGNDQEPLEVLFSRGLRTGWLEGDNHQELVDGTFSNHHGAFLGEVAKVTRGSVLVETVVGCGTVPHGTVPQGTVPPRLGDGILFENPNSALSEGGRLYAIREVPARGNSQNATASNGKSLWEMEFGKDFDTRKITVGMKCYRNDSPALERELRKTFTDRDMAKRLPVKMRLSGKIGKKLRLELQDANQNMVFAESETLLEESRNKSNEGNTLRDLVQKELSALSGTAYRLEALEQDLPANCFILGKVLRELRKQCIAALDEKRTVKNVPTASAQAGESLIKQVKANFTANSAAGRAAPSSNSANCATKDCVTVLVRNPEQISALQGLPIDKVIMDFDWGVKHDRSLEQIREFGFKAGMATLRVHKPGESHYLKNILRLAPDFALVRNLGALSILADSGIPLTGDYSLNATNSLTFDWLLSQGLTTLHPSWDLNSTQLSDLLQAIDGSKLELSLHQYMPAFHSEYCAFARALTEGRRFPECGKICTQHKVEILDHKGERHFLQSDAECRNTLFVGKPQSALKLLPMLREAQVHSFRIELLDESPETAREKILIYTQALRGEIPIEKAVRMAGVQEKYGLTDGQLFNETTWIDRKKI